MRTSLGLVIIFSFTQAHAFPQYSVKEGKDCVACHYNANGGPTNARGRYYGEHLTLEGYVDKVKKTKKAPKLKKSVPDSSDD